MAIQLDTSRIAAQTTATTTQGDIAAPLAEKSAPVLGGENLKVTSAARTDLEKLVAQLKNENAATRQSIAERRTAILSTVLDSMAERITAEERENLLKIEALNGEKAAASAEINSLNGDKAVMESLIESLDRQIEQAVKDGEDHREQVAKLKAQRAAEQAKLDKITESIKSVSSKVAGIDTKIAECTKAIASSTLTEVYAALRSASGDDKLEAEAIETQSDRDKQSAKEMAVNVALHISAALDKIDGQIRAALDEAQMKVEG